MTSLNSRERAAELLIRTISDIDPSSPARQFALTGKGHAYLRNLGEALPYRYSSLMKWLPEVCPRCGWDAYKSCDSAAQYDHVVMSTLVVVNCAGLPTVDPNEVGVHSPGWVDWTQPR